MAYEVELPPISKAIKSKEDFRNPANAELSVGPTFTTKITTHSEERAVTAVTTGEKTLPDQRPIIRKTEPWVTLVVTRLVPAPTCSVNLNNWTTIIDPGKFVENTLSSLASYVAARNTGRKHWISNLLDEKIEALRACGVEAEIRRLQ